MERNTTSHLTDVELVPQANISPIVGVFSDAHSQPFPLAIESCSSAVPDAPAIAASSIFFAETAENSYQLIQDEIAAINLYTIECDFYRVFNQTLRERDRKKLLPFFPYLKHLLLGLNKLPSYNGKLWRGVKLNLKQNYPKGKKFFWWSFSSCTVNLEVLEKEQFCGISGERTIFCISAQKGKDIKMFSNFTDEDEVLLMPGYFVVKGVMEPGNGLLIIDIEELSPPFDIFIGIPKTTTPTTPNITTPTTQAVIPSPLFQKNSVGVVKKNYTFIQKFGFQGSGDGQFDLPRAVAIDANGNIVVADKNNHRIQVFGADGKFIQKFGSRGSGDGNFETPIGVAIDANGNIVVSDYENHQIQVFGPEGKFIQKFGSFGSSDGKLIMPRGVAIDANGNIVVADTHNNRIQVFGPEGKFIQKFGNGNSDGKLNMPRGVAIDANGNIVVADTYNNRIQVFGDNGKFIQKFGSYGSNNGKFILPYSVAIDANGNIVVADCGNHRIQVFGADGKFIQKFGSKGSGDGEFIDPSGIAIDANGNIVVADCGNHRIQVFGLSSL